jgi:AraC family transcriptional regulator
MGFGNPVAYTRGTGRNGCVNPSKELITVMSVMAEQAERGDLVRPADWAPRPRVSSDGLGWVGVQAHRLCAVPGLEVDVPAFTHHMLVLFVRPPLTLDWHYGDVTRHAPPPAGAISLVPADGSSWVHWTGEKDQLHVFVEPDLLARVAAEAFDLDPARLTIPSLNAVDLPALRAAMTAVDAELAGDLGGPLLAESLANVVAIHLLRDILSPRRPAVRRPATLSRANLCAVIEYIEEHLDGSPKLAQMAAHAGLSSTYFASQFKRSTGLAPHQYVIQRRIERAKQMLQANGDLPLAQVALRAGFSDQSQFSLHFKRLVGVTPGQFKRQCKD